MLELESRNKLILENMYWADKLANDKKKKLCNFRFIRLDELKSAAYFGLLDAASRFDETLGKTFKTFATPRIIGSINDYLRVCSRWKKRAEHINEYYLNVPVCFNNARTKQSIPLFSSLTYAHHKEDFEDFFNSIVDKKLPSLYKKIFKYYYFEDMTMKEIGKIVNFTEARICQILSKCKVLLQKHWGEDKYLLWKSARSSSKWVRNVKIIS